jgi:hypothetical protein
MKEVRGSFSDKQVSKGTKIYLGGQGFRKEKATCNQYRWLFYCADCFYSIVYLTG